ncbi:helix-turn-helix domain-containing protein [Nocardia sp. NPDC050799]|uniref:PucR family transcriptional regulator n=1 Tax=Nocardia sp. NPDC050799 TaxID=3154842 RepID=UPI0033FC43FE
MRPRIEEDLVGSDRRHGPSALTTMDFDAVQAIVDDLADRLQRSVAVDDTSIRLMASSRHFGEEDELRSTSILNREIPGSVAERILDMGIADWTEPGWVEDAELGLRRRLCVPVRYHGLPLGYMWLIEWPAHPIATADVERAVAAAAHAGVLLFRGRLTHERLRNRHEAVLRELVSSDEASRAQAVEDLRAEQVFPEHARPYQVLAVRPTTLASSTTGDPELQQAVQEAAGRLLSGTAMAVAGPARAWLLLAGAEPWSDLRVESLRSQIADRLATGKSGEPDVTFGLGGVVTKLSDLHLSYRQALMAARAADLVTSFSPFARWTDLGPYQLLLRMNSSDMAAVSSVPALQALQAADHHGVLLESLECFLDHAGDVRRAASVACVHRATFYQRLRRIEDVTGCDLGSGSDRLMLHLALKIRALTPESRTLGP